MTAHRAVLVGNGKEYHCSLLDLSRNGCLISTTSNLEAEKKYRMNLQCLRFSVRVDAAITRQSMVNGAWRYGVSFMNPSKAEKQSLKKIMRLLRRIGAQNRLKTAAPLDEAIIDQQVQRTPYRSVLFLRKILRKLRV
jgi:hypothetical protein